LRLGRPTRERLHNAVRQPCHIFFLTNFGAAAFRPIGPSRCHFYATLEGDSATLHVAVSALRFALPPLLRLATIHANRHCLRASIGGQRPQCAGSRARIAGTGSAALSTSRRRSPDIILRVGQMVLAWTPFKGRPAGPHDAGGRFFI